MATNVFVQLALNQSIFSVIPDYTDISSDVLEMSIKRGRNHELNTIETGTADIVVDNTSGKYFRYNSGSAFYPYFKPLTTIRMGVTHEGSVYVRFYGVIETIKHGWLDSYGGGVPICSITCVDMLKALSRMYILPLTGTVGANSQVAGVVVDGTSGTSGQKTVKIKSISDSSTEGVDISLLHVGQTIKIADNSNSEINTIDAIDDNKYVLTMDNNLAHTYSSSPYIKKFPTCLTGTRIKDVLLEFSWPDFLMDVDNGNVYVEELSMDSSGIVALDHIHNVESTERGIFFQSRDGKMTFQDRYYRFDTSSISTFADNGINYPYIFAGLVDDDVMIYNEARVAGNSINNQTYRDAVAQSIQGRRDFQLSNSLLIDDGEAFDQAYVIVERYKNSVLRIPSMTIYPEKIPLVLFPICLGADISSKVTLMMNKAPNTAGVNKQYHIEGIEDSIVAGDVYTVKWQLWDVNLFRVFHPQNTGYLYKTSLVSYEDCHDATDADTAYNNDTVLAVGQIDDNFTSWYIWRGFVEFNTSSIGSGSSIESAEVIIEVTGYFDIDAAFNIVLTWPGSVTFPLAVGDYGTLVGQTASLGSFTVSTPAVNRKVIVITLNSTGIAAINKTGVTRFGIRSSRDISETAPSTNGDEMLSIFGTSSSGIVPRLIVKLHDAF